MSPEGIDPQEVVYGDTYRPKRTHETLPSDNGSGVSEAPLSTQLVSILENHRISIRGHKTLDYTIQQINNLIREARKDEHRRFRKVFAHRFQDPIIEFGVEGVKIWDIFEHMSDERLKELEE